MIERNFNGGGSYGNFPLLLKFLAILCIVVGIVAAVNFGTEFNGFWRERNTVVTTLWVAGGIMNALLWWALSIIVEACNKYLSRA